MRRCCLLLVTLLAPASVLADEAQERDVYERFLSRHTDATAADVLAKLPDRAYLGKLGFDPTEAEYFDRVAEQLKLNDPEREIYAQRGFVSVDHAQRYSFGSAYYSIYARDLPVLITTDSVMHALHKSYDDILMQLERQYLAPTIADVLTQARASLKKGDEDVDVYLTVALNLLAGAGAADSKIEVLKSKLGQDTAVAGLLEKIAKLEMEVPGSEGTLIRGKRRFVDYSQFRPRGHYTKAEELKRYFRAMMWLGRVDTGFEVMKSERDLQAALRLVAAVKSTKGLPRLAAMSEIIDFMVGKSDNLTAFQLAAIAEKSSKPRRIRELIADAPGATQKIRSQLVVSNPNDTVKVLPPVVFQLFGQRFVIDSFVLSQVVFDSIIFKGKKVKRMMPTGLDVMAALGNDEAVRLLAPTMESVPYGANLLAARDYVGAHRQSYWRGNLYTIWLDTLRTLDDDPTRHAHMPRVMKTQAWQRKQLQTQLGSWAELRHDTILYAKQSYTAFPSCEYPAGYVEPYPAFYASVKAFAAEAARRIGRADYGKAEHLKQRQVAYFVRLRELSEKLESLAWKELSAKPFTDDENAWLKKTIDMRGGGSGPPRYDGWYIGLYYGGGISASKWDPTIADVHTDPASGQVLEVGVGDVNYLVVAVDNEDDLTTYVGPVFSYYEFAHPASDRLTDEKWQQRIRGGKMPARPSWTDVFQGPKESRHAGR